MCADQASVEFEKGCSTDFKVARNSFHFAKRGFANSLLDTVWFNRTSMKFTTVMK